MLVMLSPQICKNIQNEFYIGIINVTQALGTKVLQCCRREMTNNILFDISKSNKRTE